MKKAIKIDVVSRELSYVSIEKFSDIYKNIGNGCELFCVPIQFENEDCIYSDDEALLKEVEGGFMMKEWSYPLCGNAIVLGTDEDGDDFDCKTTIEELMPNIIWVSKVDAQTWQNLALSTPPSIYTI
jgi:hypothetical protein